MLRSGLKSSLNSARSSVIRANHLLPASRPTLSLSAQHSPASWQVGMQQQQQRFRSQLAPRRTKYRKAHKGRVAVSITRRFSQYNAPESSRTFSLVLFSRLSFSYPPDSFLRADLPRGPPSSWGHTVSVSSPRSVSRRNNSLPPKSPSNERSRPSRGPSAGCASSPTCPSASRGMRRGWVREKERSSIGLVGQYQQRTEASGEVEGEGLADECACVCRCVLASRPFRVDQGTTRQGRLRGRWGRDPGRDC